MPKYVIRNSRYINGTLVAASPDAPAIIELEEEIDLKKDKELFELDKAQEKLKPHYSVKTGTPGPRVDAPTIPAGVPVTDTTVEATPGKPMGSPHKLEDTSHSKSSSKRPSDKDI